MIAVIRRFTVLAVWRGGCEHCSLPKRTPGFENEMATFRRGVLAPLLEYQRRAYLLF
jgi:hypothetical protein